MFHRLLGRAGVLDISDYSEFLMFEERAVLNVSSASSTFSERSHRDWLAVGGEKED
jgi:hypothetical protein